MDKDTEKENMKENTAVETQEATASGGWWPTAGMIGTVLTVVAWCMLMFYPLVSLWGALAALVLSVAGLRTGRGCLRDIIITSVVASAVLVVVHVIFTWGLDYVVNTL